MATPKYSINFVGDVMLGRLIDQLFSQHVHEPSEAKIIQSFLQSHPELRSYGPASPWGDTLPLFHAASLNVINLETSVTTSSVKWPDKVFNYRMHPQNLEALKPPRIDFANLANNHTLDFSEEGLVGTVNALREANIKFAGAGISRNEALAPSVLSISPTPSSHSDSDRPKQQVKIWAGSDHPSDWSKVESFHLIDYTSKTKMRLHHLLTTEQTETDSSSHSLKVFSVHWGPNYAWTPEQSIRDLAHFLVDKCDVDIIHGQSSHHIQGVETYKGKLIIYGCGDFVDDYALVEEYRNDLSAIWRVNIAQENGKPILDSLEIFPTRCKHFQTHRLATSDPDFEWIKRRITTLSAKFDTKVDEKLGDQNQLIVSLRR